MQEHLPVIHTYISVVGRKGALKPLLVAGMGAPGLQQGGQGGHLALGRHGGLDDAQAAVLGQQVGVDQVDVGRCDLLQDALDHHRAQQPRVQVICTPV